VQDFTSASAHNQTDACHRLNRFLSQKFANFDSRHDAPRHESPPEEQWLIDTNLLFGQTSREKLPDFYCRYSATFLTHRLRSWEDGKLENRVAELEAQLDDVRSRLDDAESQIDILKSATDELTSAVDDFDYDNWRNVVPDIQQAAANVESAVNDLESLVDDAKSAAN